MNQDNWCGGFEVQEFTTTSTGFRDMIPGGISFFINNGKVEFDRFESNPMYYHQLLRMCSPLVAILSKKANMFSNGEIIFTNATTGNPVRGIDKDWVKLIKNPNHTQTETEFLQTAYTYTLLRGFCYAYPIYSVGFDAPTSIWLLPPWYVTIEPIEVDFFSLASGNINRKIVFNWRGTRTEFSEDELILFKDPGSIDINQFTWLPESRLTAVSRPIATLIAETESLYNLTINRGPSGIVSNATGKGEVSYVPITDDEQTDLQSKYKNYGTLTKQQQLIITSASLSYTKIGGTMKEMMFFEIHEREIMDLCDCLNFPYELMSNAKGQTYENMEAAKRSAYQDVIIPTAKIIMQQLQQGLKIGDNIKLEMDYSDVECLQEAMKDTGAGTLAMNEAQTIAWNEGLITKNDWLESLGLERKNKPEFDMYVYEFNKWSIEQGYTPDTVAIAMKGMQTNDPANQPPQPEADATAK